MSPTLTSSRSGRLSGYIASGSASTASSSASGVSSRTTFASCMINHDNQPADEGIDILPVAEGVVKVDLGVRPTNFLRDATSSIGVFGPFDRLGGGGGAHDFYFCESVNRRVMPMRWTDARRLGHASHHDSLRALCSLACVIERAASIACVTAPDVAVRADASASSICDCADAAAAAGAPPAAAAP